MKKKEENSAVNVEVPTPCGGKPKPSTKPEGAGKGKWVCADEEWVWKEELGGV